MQIYFHILLARPFKSKERIEEVCLGIRFYEIQEILTMPSIEFEVLKHIPQHLP